MFFRKFKSFFFILILFLFFSIEKNIYATKADYDSIPLLLNIDIQIETTEAINLMYDFQFEKSDKQFNWLIQEFGWHPLPYFLLGLSTWWKIAPDLENKSLDNQFLFLMDTSIILSKKIYENYRRPCNNTYCW